MSCEKCNDNEEIICDTNICSNTNDKTKTKPTNPNFTCLQIKKIKIKSII